MSNADDFVATQTEIEAIANDKIKSPGLPIDIFLQEAENLYHWCQDDKDKLAAASLDWTSDLDGQIGSGGSFSAVLSDGTHTITASVIRKS